MVQNRGCRLPTETLLKKPPFRPRVWGRKLQQLTILCNTLLYHLISPYWELRFVPYGQVNILNSMPKIHSTAQSATGYHTPAAIVCSVVMPAGVELLST
jgi:hypothetical protein